MVARWLFSTVVRDGSAWLVFWLAVAVGLARRPEVVGFVMGLRQWGGEWFWQEVLQLGCRSSFLVNGRPDSTEIGGDR